MQERGGGTQPMGRGDRTRPMGKPTGHGGERPDLGGPRADRRAGRTVAAGRGVAKGAGAIGRLTASAGRSTYHAARRASEAQGAGESGLSRLIEVHAFSSAGDAAVTIGLAGTVFFAASSGDAARSSVLLFLLLTMLPFSLVAPLIGPLLDRFSRGRRWAIGGTLAARGFLCWVLAETVENNSKWLFPIALSVLILSKAYLVTRSAAAPRLLPKQLTLVKANGRLSLAGVVGASAAGVLAGGAAKLGGSAWALRVAFALFVVGAVLAVLLPAQVDNAAGENSAPLGLTRRKRRSVEIAPDVVSALRANSGLRWLSGFLTIFLAFLMRMHPFPGWEDRKTILVALVIGAAGVGNALGTVMGSLLKIASPRVVVLATLLADAAMAVVAAIFFGLWTAVAVGLVAGVCQQLGKLALDSQIQDTVPEGSRTSVFGRSETLLQLSWVIGGIVAVIIPVNATFGMILAAVLLTLWATVVLIWHTGHQLPVPDRVRQAAPHRGSSRRGSAEPTEAMPARGPHRESTPRRPSGGPVEGGVAPAPPGTGDPGPQRAVPVYDYEAEQAGERQRQRWGSRDRSAVDPDEAETIGISREQVRRHRSTPVDDDRRARWEDRFRGDE